MKIERGSTFAPITITLENLREAKVLLSALIIGQSRIANSFTALDQCIIYNLVKDLKAEGIVET